MSDIIKTAPAVFCVGDTYQIMIPVSRPCLMWVRVGDRCFFDDSNGILRSDCTTHRITVPAKALDGAKKYTLCFRGMIERRPYFSDTEDVVEAEYDFRPVTGGRTLMYHISDAHNNVDGPVSAAKKFEEEYGPIDLLILNGDIPNDSGNIAHFDNIYSIVERITGGHIPTVFSRGNHDMRGIFAEKLADHTPTDGGNSYFTVRVGDIWAILLDCGEDKPDDHPEYGNTVCCHAFRQRQTDFIKKVIENRENEYAAAGVRHRFVISHVPFTHKFRPPFNIEEDTYEQWIRLLEENIEPELMLFGHEHYCGVSRHGDSHDAYGTKCPTVVGSVCGHDDTPFTGTGIIVEEGSLQILFTSRDGTVGDETL